MRCALRRVRSAVRGGEAGVCKGDMATVHILRHGRDTLRLTISGPRLITGEGDAAVM